MAITKVTSDVTDITSLSTALANDNTAGGVNTKFLGLAGGTTTGVTVFKAVQETSVSLSGTVIDLSVGNLFYKTISGATNLTVSNVPASGTVSSFILELTNGGSAVITWWGNVKWAGGTAPTLTTSGRDVLGFYTYNNGTTWTGLVLAKDVK